MTAHNKRPNTPTFLQTVRILLRAARSRAEGRKKRQRKLLRHRTGSDTDSLAALGYFFAVIGMCFLHGFAAFCIDAAVKEAARFSQEKTGHIMVSSSFYSRLDDYRNAEPGPNRQRALARLESNCHYEAQRRTERRGGDTKAYEQLLLKTVQEGRIEAFISEDSSDAGLGHLKAAGPLAGLIGSSLLVWWLIMLTFQGEGLELDIQRRRHPMWEWLLSHPVHPGAVFLAEMLSPIAANPAYLAAPVFPAILFGMTYEPAIGLLALFVVGIPLTIGAAALGKAIEIGVMLRYSPLKRGAIIGIMGWLGYAAMISFIFGFYVIPRLMPVAGDALYPLANAIPSGLLDWLTGTRMDGSHSLLAGMGVCWLTSAGMIGTGVGISVWGTRRGIAGHAESPPRSRKNNRESKLFSALFKEPLYRKELLWFTRDRSAIIQTILIPITIASVQLINLRHIVEHFDASWHNLAGAAVLLGTYLLWILGPRSLASEGPALWIAQTWPRGMEDLMKAKAKLWFLLASVVVFPILCFVALRYPFAWWKVGLISIAWVGFGRSLAEKSVTLVTVASSSGEAEPIPKGRRMAAALGMLTFSIGILTQQWQLVCIGVVYSWITAAAMWQNFRARLPYLFDPWSEKIPPPPTVMHAMISIGILIELGAVITGLLAAFSGPQNMAITQPIAYALTAGMVSIFTSKFLSVRGLPPSQVWSWQDASTGLPWRTRLFPHCGTSNRRIVRNLLAGALVGAVLALFAHGYILILAHFEPFGEMIRTTTDRLNSIPGMRLAYYVMAVFMAPFAEEYLFRGLLYRALDREWGGWKAMVGSAAFFAIYHPPMAWLPVGLLGLINAYLFKSTGRLTPAIVLHMVYNAVVLTLQLGL